MEIPSKYHPKETEPRILTDWLNKGYFNAEVDSGANPFSIAIPPPNITGILHMGHALNNTIQDVLIRYQRMLGSQALWMPGTDHAGIATQNVVEKDLAKENLRKEGIGREKFIERLWNWRQEYGSTIINQLKKLGASCDWRRTRFTMDSGYSDAVNEVFIKLYDKGLIYRGNRIINWCSRCQTALSDEESTHKEVDGWLYYIKYPVVQNKTASSPGQDHIVVATTRPETMLGDTAVAINPQDKRYRWLKDSKVILPIAQRELAVIEDEVIDIEFGTGVVKVTPAHDPDDFAMGKKHNLEFINIMNDDATLNSNVPDDFIGMDRFKARATLIRLLEDKKLIQKKEPYRISAGHCYRCHTIVEPRISLQWFVNMKPLAKEAIKVVEQDKVKFYPQRWKKVYLNWMYNIQDWCISRQIWWGHRLPVYYCNNCIGNTGSKSQNTNSKSQINFKPQNLKQKGIIVSKIKPEKCPDCDSRDIYQDPDVLDTWFSSWLWPFATLGWPEKTKELEYFYPTNCLVTASEILFFWVARMIMSGLEFMDEIPFSDVLIHGTVRDDKGIKMSKSLGNTIDPLEVIDKFGADALRFSLMLLAASGSDVYLSDEKFLVGRNFSNKIWNATRFILLKIQENNLEVEDLEFELSDPIDSWIIEELNQAIAAISDSLDSYCLNDAAKKIYDFIWRNFCDWYIEIVKDNFNLNKVKVLIYVLLNSMKLLHPFMPFISEEIFSLIKSYTNLTLGPTIVKADWPKKFKFDMSEEEITKVRVLFDTIRELRNIKVDLGLSQKKVNLEVSVKNKDRDLWEKNKAWIQRLTQSKDILFKDKLERTLYKNQKWSLNLEVEAVGAEAFLFSLEKKIKNLDKF